MKPKLDHDALVVGAGVSGIAMAVALRAAETLRGGTQHLIQ